MLLTAVISAVCFASGVTYATDYTVSGTQTLADLIGSATLTTDDTITVSTGNTLTFGSVNNSLGALNITGGTVNVTAGDNQNAFVKGGTISVTNGGSLNIDLKDTFGWSTAQGPSAVTLNDATLSLKARQTWGVTNLNLTGNAHIAVAENSTTGDDAPSLNPLGSNLKISVSGNNNVVDVGIRMRSPLTVVNSGQLTLNGNIYNDPYAEGNHALQFNVSGSSTTTLTGNIDSDTQVSVYGNAGTVTFGNGTKAGVASVQRIELGDVPSVETSELNVAANYTLKITGNNNSDSYKSASLILGEWLSSTSVNVAGKLLAKDARLLLGDSGATIDIANGGTLAVKGIASVKTGTDSSLNLTLNEGATFVLGELGIDLKGTGAKLLTLNGGTLASSAETMTINANITVGGNATIASTRYAFSEDGNSIAVGEGTSTISISGNITLSEGAVLNVEASSISGNITLGEGAILNTGASTLKFNDVSELTNNGTINWSEGAHLDLGQDSYTEGQTFTVGNMSGFTTEMFVGLGGRQVATYHAGSGDVLGYIDISGQLGNITWNGTTENHVWNDEQSNTVWMMNGNAAYFVDLDNVTFGENTEGVSSVVTMDSTVRTTSVTVNGNYTFEVNVDNAFASFAGTGSLTKIGAATLTLEQAPSTGSLVVSEGSVLLSQTLGGEANLGGIKVEENGTLLVSLAGGPKGTKLVLNGESSGTVEVQSGMLRVNNNEKSVVGNSTIVLNDGTGLVFANSSDIISEVSNHIKLKGGTVTLQTWGDANYTSNNSLSGKIIGSGTLNKTDGGKLTISADMSEFTGAISMGNTASNRLVLDTNATISGLTMGNQTSFAVSDNRTVTVGTRAENLSNMGSGTSFSSNGETRTINVGKNATLTDNRYLWLNGGTVDIEGGGTMNVFGISLSSSGNNKSVVNIRANTTLNIFGTSNDATAGNKAAFGLAHWNAANEVNVYGTLTSEAALVSVAGSEGAVNVQDGGLFVMKNGLVGYRRAADTAAKSIINVNSGGTLSAGSNGNEPTTTALEVNLKAGSTIEAYAEETIVGQTLNLGKGNSAINFKAAEGKTLTIKSLAVSDTDNGTLGINVTGTGIVKFDAAVATDTLTVNTTTGMSSLNLSGEATVNANLTVTGSTTLAGTDASIVIGDAASFSTGNETVTKLTVGTDTTISGTGTVSVSTAGITYTNAAITVRASGVLETAATLNSSKLTVTGGGTVATKVEEDSTNSFDASEGSVTVNTGTVTEATVGELNVGAGQSATFTTEKAGENVTATVTEIANVAGTVSANVNVAGASETQKATFTAQSGATVGGNLTVNATTGSLVLTTVGTSDNTDGVLSVDNTLTATLTATTTNIVLADSAKATINSAMAVLKNEGDSASVLLAKAGMFNIEGLSGGGVTTLTTAQLGLLGITPVANVSYTLASTSMFGRAAESYLTLTGTYTSADTPDTLTATAVGTGYADGILTIGVAESLDGVTGDFNVIVGEDAWQAIVDAMNGDIYQNATVSLTDANGVTYKLAESNGDVTLNGYTGTGTKGEFYVAYIPEPATATLSLLALAALAARRRRKG